MSLTQVVGLAQLRIIELAEEDEGVTVPEPSDSLPPGLSGVISDLMSWVQYGAIAFAIVGVIVGGGLLWVGRSQGEGSEKVSTIGRAIMGGAIIAAATGLVTFVVDAVG